MLLDLAVILIGRNISPYIDFISKLFYRMAELLSRFRINYSDLVMVPDMDKPPKETTKTWFDSLIRQFIRSEELTGKISISYLN